MYVAMEINETLGNKDAQSEHSAHSELWVVKPASELNASFPADHLGMRLQKYLQNACG